MNRLIRAELLKLHTMRVTYGLLAAAVAVTALFASLEASRTGRRVAPISTAAGLSSVTTATGVAMILAAVLGVIVTSGEFRYGSATLTYLDDARPDSRPDRQGGRRGLRGGRRRPRRGSRRGRPSGLASCSRTATTSRSARPFSPDMPLAPASAPPCSRCSVSGAAPSSARSSRRSSACLCGAWSSSPSSAAPSLRFVPTCPIPPPRRWAAPSSVPQPSGPVTASPASTPSVVAATALVAAIVAACSALPARTTLGIDIT